MVLNVSNLSYASRVIGLQNKKRMMLYIEKTLMGEPISPYEGPLLVPYRPKDIGC